MKYSLLLSTLLLTLFACNMSDETDYKNLAKDTCDCVNLFTDDLSDEMMDILETSNGDEAKLEELMMSYMMKDAEAAMKDAETLQGSGTAEMTECMEKIEKKYDDVYTTLSEDEVVAKIMKELEKMDDCNRARIILKMGIAAM